MSFGSVQLMGNFYKIECKPIPNIIAALKELPDRQYRWNEKYWTVPVQHRDLVEQFAKRHKLDFGYRYVEDNSKVFVNDPLPELTIDIPIKRPLFPFQAPGIAYCMEKRRLIIGDDMGLGKAQPLSAKILTPAGWVLMRDIRPDDTIFTSGGTYGKVVSIHPQGLCDVYKISFSDGSSTRCTSDHLWKVITSVRKKRNSNYLVKSLSDISKLGLIDGSVNYRFYVPICEKLNFLERELHIHPYTLGALLGDGGLSQNLPIFTSIDSFIIEKVSNLLPENVSLKPKGNGTISYHLSKTTGKQHHPNQLTTALRLYGLWGGRSEFKFIPEDYLFNTVEKRIQLLHGLMDTDGYVNKGKRGNSVHFCTSSKRLCDDFVFLVQSLGGVARKSFKKNKFLGCWIVTLALPNSINPFSLPRKVELVSLRTKYFPCRAITSIELIEAEECQCIKVDAPDKCYITDDCIVTHNTTQAIVAIAGLNHINVDVLPVLIICPSSVKINWEREVKMNTHLKPIILADSIKNTFMEYYRVGIANVFIVNYESLKKYFVDHIDDPGPGKPLRLNHIHFREKYVNFFKAVIVDESHRTKHLRAKTTKFTKGVCSGKEVVFALTGTPVINKPKDLIAQLGIIDRLKDFGGYKEFEKRYCSGPKEASNLSELNYMLNKTCFYRRNKTDPNIQLQLPDKMRQVVICELNAHARSEYRHAVSDLESYMKKYKEASDEQIQKSMRGEVMVRIGILKNISARGKLADVFDFVSDVVDNGEKIVLFAVLKDIINQVLERFPKSVKVTGDENDSQKQAAVDKFQNDPNTHILIGNIKAAGVGITLTASSRVAFIEQGWHAAIMDQCEDRCFRIGAKNNVMCTYFIGKDTIDEWNYNLIQSKREMANQVTGGEDITEVSIIDSVMTLFNS